MTKILFICHGNICRSPMAEFVFKSLIEKSCCADLFEVASAAVSREELGKDIYPKAKEILNRHSVMYEHRSARQITKNDLAYYDLIVCMEKYNIDYLEHLFAELPLERLSLIMSYTNNERDVSDPWYTDDFESAYSDIVAGCSGLLQYLLNRDYTGLDDCVQAADSRIT